MQRVVIAVPPERVNATKLNFLLNLAAEKKIDLEIIERKELPKWVAELIHGKVQSSPHTSKS